MTAFDIYELLNQLSETAGVVSDMNLSMVGFICNYPLNKQLQQMCQNVVGNMSALATRILKNRKQVAPALSNVPHVEVIMAEKPLSPCVWGSGSIINMIRFSQTYVTLRQKIYYDLDGKYFSGTDEFFVRAEILPAHIREKIFAFDGEVDITEEINDELRDLKS